MKGFSCFVVSCRTKRAWLPNVQSKTYRSDILKKSLDVRLTTHAMRCIDKAGGFDAYILHTSDKNLGTKSLGVTLKKQMRRALAANPQLTPPPRARRLQRKPKRWSLGPPPFKRNIFRLNLEHLLPPNMKVGADKRGGASAGTAV